MGTWKAPASPHTTRAGESRSGGHQGKVETRRGGGRAEKGMEAGIIAKALNTSSDELFIFYEDWMDCHITMQPL